MADGALRYNISDWRQLTQCLSNYSNELHIRTRDLKQDTVEGIVVEVYHDSLGVVFSYLVNAQGRLIGPRTGGGVNELATNEVLAELSRFGFFITFNHRDYLSENQLDYLRSLQGLGFDKIRILRVYESVSELNASSPHVVAFNIPPNPGWLDNTYTASQEEFTKSLSNGSAIDLDDVSKTNKYRWDWLDYVASIQDILDDNEEYNPPEWFFYTSEEVDDLLETKADADQVYTKQETDDKLSEKIDKNSKATYSDLGLVYVADFDDIEEVENPSEESDSIEIEGSSESYSYLPVDGVTVVNIQNPAFAKESGVYLTVSSAISSVSVNGVSDSSLAAIEGAGAVIYLSSLISRKNAIKITHAQGEVSITIYNKNAQGEDEPTEGLEESPKLVNPFHLVHYIKRWWDKIRRKPTFLGAYVVEDRAEITGGLTVGGSQETIIGGEGNLNVAGAGSVTFAKSGGTTFSESVTMNKAVTVNTSLIVNGNDVCINSGNINVKGKASVQEIELLTGARNINIDDAGHTNMFDTYSQKDIIIGQQNNVKRLSRSIILGNNNDTNNSINTIECIDSIIAGSMNTLKGSKQAVVIGNNNTSNSDGQSTFIFGDSNKIVNYCIMSTIVGANNCITGIGVRYSSTFGVNNVNNGSYSFVTGRDNISSGESQLIGGHNNIGNKDSLFMIGNGSSSCRNNVIEVTRESTKSTSFYNKKFGISLTTSYKSIPLYNFPASGEISSDNDIILIAVRNVNSEHRDVHVYYRCIYNNESVSTDSISVTHDSSDTISISNALSIKELKFRSDEENSIIVYAYDNDVYEEVVPKHSILDKNKILHINEDGQLEWEEPAQSTIVVDRDVILHTDGSEANSSLSSNSRMLRFDSNTIEFELVGNLSSSDHSYISIRLLDENKSNITNRILGDLRKPYSFDKSRYAPNAKYFYIDSTPVSANVEVRAKYQVELSIEDVDNEIDNHIRCIRHNSIMTDTLESSIKNSDTETFNNISLYYHKDAIRAYGGDTVLHNYYTDLIPINTGYDDFEISLINYDNVDVGDNVYYYVGFDENKNAIWSYTGVSVNNFPAFEGARVDKTQMIKNLSYSYPRVRYFVIVSYNNQDLGEKSPIFNISTREILQKTVDIRDLVTQTELNKAIEDNSITEEDIDEICV